MKTENQELLIKAIGTIDGMSFLADEKTRSGLEVVSIMLCKILDSEGTNDD